jgi:hypothetical protein
VWSVASGEKLFIVERNFNGPATAASWASRDTSRFVIGFANGDLHLFYGESGKVIKTTFPYSDLTVSTLSSCTVTMLG